MIQLSNFYTQQQWRSFEKAAAREQTPVLIINTDIVRDKYRQLVHYFPYADVFYAVKANDEKPVLQVLQEEGASFDVASTEELNMVLKLGVSPEKISFGNTIKKQADIGFAYRKGIRLFATDSIADLKNIATNAPGSKVFCRILIDGSKTADWPLSKKFGCAPSMAVDLMKQAKTLGVIPYGISFHVGSQQRGIQTWQVALRTVKKIFDDLEKAGIRLQLVNMGGGLPAQYMKKNHPLSLYAEKITRYLQDCFGKKQPRIIMEPGRSLVAEAGVLVAEVIQITRKDPHDKYRWMYLDAGICNGLFESIQESIRYPIYCPRQGKGTRSFILAGPTCDSMDVLYEHNRPVLPINIVPKDRLFFLSCGVYSASCAMVGFNGFKPVKVAFCNNQD